MNKYRLGKTAPVRTAKLKFRTYANFSRLPTPPDSFGCENLITAWGMLGNDIAGDCVLAGGAHETMLWNAAAGRTVNFSTTSVLSDYTAITGYKLGDDSTDQGTNMLAAANYRMASGLLDADGNRHLLAAALDLDRGNLEELRYAIYLFKAVGVGFNLLDSAEDQFDNHQPWDLTPGAEPEGGHYTPGVAWRDGMLKVITWGAEQLVTPAFYRDNNDETVAYVSPEFLIDSKSPDGFDLQQLLDDLRLLGSA